MPTPTSAALSGLLAPLSPETFFTQHWNRRALYLPGEPGKFKDLFDRAAFDRAAETCPILKVNHTDAAGWPTEQKIAPAEIGASLAAGKTVCAGEIHSDNPVLSEFLARFQSSFQVAGSFYFNSYLSPDGAGFGLHFDAHPVWILQVEGSKRWRFSEEPAVPAAVTNVAFPTGRDVLKLPWATITRPTESELREVVLRPGDLLYLPKACWHQAAAVGGSLALTLAQKGAAPLDILQFALAPLLGGTAYRDLLPAFWSQAPHKEVDAVLKPRFAELLAALQGAVAEITPDQLIGLWRQAERSHRTTSLHNAH